MNRAEYRAYLAGDDWRRRREALVCAHGSKCELCGVPRCLARSWDGADLNVHHLTYANLGEEKPEDVEALCEPCHNARELGHPARTFRDEVEWAVIAWLAMFGKHYGLMSNEGTWKRFYEEARENRLTVMEVDATFGKMFRGAARAFTFAAWQDACAEIGPARRQMSLDSAGDA